MLVEKLSLKAPPRSFAETFDLTGSIIVGSLVALLVAGVVFGQIRDRKDREGHRRAYQEYPEVITPSWLDKVFFCKCCKDKKENIE